MDAIAMARNAIITTCAVSGAIGRTR